MQTKIIGFGHVTRLIFRELRADKRKLVDDLGKPVIPGIMRGRNEGRAVPPKLGKRKHASLEPFPQVLFRGKTVELGSQLGDVRCADEVVLKTGLCLGVGAQEAQPFGNAEMAASVVFRMPHARLEQSLIRRFEIAAAERRLVQPGRAGLGDQAFSILAAPLPACGGRAAPGGAHGVEIGAADDEVGGEHGAVVQRDIGVEAAEEGEQAGKVAAGLSRRAGVPEGGVGDVERGVVRAEGGVREQRDRVRPAAEVVHREGDERARGEQRPRRRAQHAHQLQRQQRQDGEQEQGRARGEAARQARLGGPGGDVHGAAGGAWGGGEAGRAGDRSYIGLRKGVDGCMMRDARVKIGINYARNMFTCRCGVSDHGRYRILEKKLRGE